jgi:hypothetical protein
MDSVGLPKGPILSEDEIEKKVAFKFTLEWKGIQLYYSF